MQHRHGHTVLNIVHDQRTRWARRVLRASEQKNKNDNKMHKKCLISKHYQITHNHKLGAIIIIC